MFPTVPCPKCCDTATDVTDAQCHGDMLTVVLWCGRCRTYRQITTPISQGGDNIISGMYAEIARAKHLHGNASIHNPALSVTQAAGILLEERDAGLRP